MSEHPRTTMGRIAALEERVSELEAALLRLLELGQAGADWVGTLNVGGSHKRTAAAQGKDTQVNFSELTGKKVFIRAVTHYYTGLLADVSMGSDGTWLHLEDAAWVADTGRFGEALASGKLSEVEPFPADCWVSAGAVVDVCEWSHDLPRKAV